MSPARPRASGEPPRSSWRREAPPSSRSAATGELDSLAREIGSESHAVDLADPAATRAAAKAVQPIDRLVNNAGTVTLEPFLETTSEAFEQQMAVNVLAAMIISQEVAKSLIARQAKGTIVNVSLDRLLAQGVPDHTAYCATKGALDALTRVMAVELGRAWHPRQRRQPGR